MITKQITIHIPPKMMQGLVNRFWSKVQKTDSCWLWTGTIAQNDYGIFYFDYGQYKAHRVAYELVKGPIPDGLALDHLCRNPPCVNPDHLEPVTIEVNFKRSPDYVGHRQFCPRGHLLEGDNLVPYKLKLGWRECLTCAREYGRRFMFEKRRRLKP